MALLTGLGALLGGVSSTPAARTSTQSSNASTSNTNTSTPTYTPAQQQLQDQAGSTASSIMSGTNVAPMETSGENAINTTYKDLGDRLTQSLAARGFSNSGQQGSTALQTELGRAGSVGSLEGNLQSFALQNQLNAVNAAGNLAYKNPTTTTTGSGTNAYSGSSTAAGSTLAGGLSGGITGLLAQLNQSAAMSAYS